MDQLDRITVASTEALTCVGGGSVSSKADEDEERAARIDGLTQRFRTELRAQVAKARADAAQARKRAESAIQTSKARVDSAKQLQAHVRNPSSPLRKTK